VLSSGIFLYGVSVLFTSLHFTSKRQIENGFSTFLDYPQLFENDPNQNSGFDIKAFTCINLIFSTFEKELKNLLRISS
jgi:hypothetical protein